MQPSTGLDSIDEDVLSRIPSEACETVTEISDENARGGPGGGGPGGDLEAAAVEAGEMVVVAMAALHTLRTHGRPLHCRVQGRSVYSGGPIRGLPSSSHGSTDGTN